MKEYVIKLYSFDELSEEVKHELCNKEREETYNFGYWAQEEDAAERIATLDVFCNVFGITYRIDYDHQLRFISWRFEDYDIDDRKIRGKYLLRFLNKFYYDIRSRRYLSLPMYKNDGDSWHYKFRHSRITWEEQACPFTGMCYDCDILQKIFEWYHNPDWGISLHDLFEKCFSYFLKSWEDEDDFRMSDEYISEMILLNREDQFYLEDGTEFNGDVEELEEYAA